MQCTCEMVRCAVYLHSLLSGQPSYIGKLRKKTCDLWGVCVNSNKKLKLLIVTLRKQYFTFFNYKYPNVCLRSLEPTRAAMMLTLTLIVQQVNSQLNVRTSNSFWLLSIYYNTIISMKILNRNLHHFRLFLICFECSSVIHNKGLALAGYKFKTTY